MLVVTNLNACQWRSTMNYVMTAIALAIIAVVMFAATMDDGLEMSISSILG